MNLSTQYDEFANEFSNVHDEDENSNRDNRMNFYRSLDFLKPGGTLLDLACGDGVDLLYYQSLGVKVAGLDASAEMVKLAHARLPDVDIRVSNFEKLPYPDASFDYVLCKYSIQTVLGLSTVFAEVARVLKPGGVFAYLATHPMRQYFEKKNPRADYFVQTVVESHILNDAIVVREPTHTFEEYLSDDFLKKFELVSFKEYHDPAAEPVEGRIYPGYFIVIAKVK